MKRFLRIMRDLRARDDRSVRLLRSQVDCALKGVRVIEQTLEGTISLSQGGHEVTRAEHAGDSAREAVITELVSALAPALDREDLFRVSRSIDDVLDNLRDFVRELILFDVSEVYERQRFQPMVTAIDQTLEVLGSAIDQIVDDVEAFPRTVLAAKKASNTIRRCYDEALAELLVGPVDAAMLRHRELLRRLDVVGLRLGEAADALADGAIKRNH